MTTKLTRRVVRETSFIDYRTRRPVIICLEEGGKIIRLRVKGRRTVYTVTVEQVFKAGAANLAAELKREKAERRRLLREQRTGAT